MLGAIPVSPPSSTSSNSTPNAGSTNSTTKSAPGHGKVGSVSGSIGFSVSAETGSVVSHDDSGGDGWLEVGKRNRTVLLVQYVFRLPCLCS